MTNFQGFNLPESNYSKLPHQFIDLLPIMTTLGEIKVVLYILRHTWGYSEFGLEKELTIDEIMNGRKRNDGTRMDNGTGLSRNSVRQGANDAVEHGLIWVREDKSDLARIKTFYSIAICQDLIAEGQDLTTTSQNLPPVHRKKPLERKTTDSTNVESTEQGSVAPQPPQHSKAKTTPPKSPHHGELFEIVLQGSMGVTYEKGMKLDTQTRGHVNACVGALTARGVTPSILRQYYDDYEAWAEGLAVPQGVVKLATSVQKWMNETNISEETPDTPPPAPSGKFKFLGLRGESH